uniref:Putative cytochrome P450 n=1 Tax=Moniliophthora roreri TaxID=221103 RepID=A0A0W0FHZ6_MONRR
MLTTTDLVVVGVTVFLTLYFVKFSKPISFLKKLPTPQNASWLTGHLEPLFDPLGFSFHENVVRDYGGVIKLKTLFGGDQLYVTDPRALNHVVMNDGDIFDISPMSVALNLTLFGKGLSGVTGSHHKKQRKILNPIFSANYLKGLVPLFHEVGLELQEMLTSRIGEKQGATVDVLKLISCASLELITRGALGHSFGNLEADAPFRHAAKSLMPTLSDVRVGIPLLPNLRKLGTPAVQRWLVERIPSAPVQSIKNIIDTFQDTAYMMYDGHARKLRSGVANEEKNMMSLLFEANARAAENERLSQEEVMGLMSLVTFAGLDSTSGAISRIIHMLSGNPEMQERLRREIIDSGVTQNMSTTGDLNNLPFLDAIVKETLRLFPPLITVDRIAVKDTVLPLLKPIQLEDGTMAESLPIKKGTPLWIGIAMANRSPEVWGPDATEFKPERWLDAANPVADKDARLPGAWSSIMTFLGGPRTCIGYRFALLEIKVIISGLIEKFHFEPSSERINWRLDAISGPHVEGESDVGPRMPLKVSFIGTK